MKNKKILLALFLIIGMFFAMNTSYAAQKVVATQNYKINSNEITKRNPDLDQHNYFYEPMSSVYEFFDEKGQYNIVYELNNTEKLSWVKLDKNMKKIK